MLFFSNMGHSEGHSLPISQSMTKNPIELTSESQLEQIKKDHPVVLLDFWANWCPPCKQLIPILESFGEKSENPLIVKINIDTFPQLASTFGIRSIPTLVLMHDSKEVKRKIGGLTLSELEVFCKIS